MLTGKWTGQADESAHKAEAGGASGLAGDVGSDEVVVTEWVFRCSPIFMYNFESVLKPPYQSEAWCTTILMTMK